MDTQALLELLQDGGLTVYPLTVGSIVALAILVERLWRFRGIDRETRSLTRRVVDALVDRDLPAARELCQGSKTPVAAIYRDAMRWQNIGVEDLERVLATLRQEAASELFSLAVEDDGPGVDPDRGSARTWLMSIANY